MRAEDWIEVFKSFPLEKHYQLVLTMSNGMEIALDTLFRYETNHLLCRGRLSGTTDPGRVYCVPYDQMCFVRLDRETKETEVREMFGDVMAGYDPRIKAEDIGSEKSPGAVAAAAESPAPAAPAVPAAAAVTPTMSPALNRNNLLERIRANRGNTRPPAT
jgi:hypothetical protein